ncbi:hypothetical protein ISF6_4550 [Piscinibacter sakaiensis]|uniref:DUF5666 domain-containing protein n=1 Tax=Piscinibacter sakaiensis TaxID=1547922 RepID=A0A0K8NWQ6_PISS1|nr:hypothetical protein ISF6_4550 [Piscinibacter sakaiensis]
MAALSLLCSACGGGGGGGAVADAGGATAAPSGATPAPTATAYAAGPVSGLGSVIVNGVRYDDSAARVVGDDDVVRSGDDRRLRLGMQVEIGSGAVDDTTGRARAESIRVVSELVGRVEAVQRDASGALQSFTVLGQTVRIQRPGTVVDDSLTGGLAAIVPGLLVEVHARRDGNVYLATAIEARSAAAVTRFKLRGVIGSVDTAIRRFTIGSASFSYAGTAAAALAATPAVGLAVRLELATAVPASGVFEVLALRPAQRGAAGLTAAAAAGDARLRGTITRAIADGQFELDGLTVRIDASTRLDKLSAAGLVAGVTVDVRGVLQGSVLQASRISLRGGGELGAGLEDSGGVELHGLAGDIDRSARRFTLTHAGGTRYTVTYPAAFDAVVAAAARLEVKGTLDADGRSIQATRIQRED